MAALQTRMNSDGRDTRMRARSCCCATRDRVAPNYELCLPFLWANQLFRMVFWFFGFSDGFLVFWFFGWFFIFLDGFLFFWMVFCFFGWFFGFSNGFSVFRMGSPSEKASHPKKKGLFLTRNLTQFFLQKELASHDTPDAAHN